MRNRYLTTALFLVAGALLACQPESPESRLESAGESLEEAETDLRDLQASIEKHEDALLELRKERRALKDRLLTLEERVEARATDVAVFRSVQTALLETPSLNPTAISADAHDGIVTLLGIADSPEQRSTAIAIAESIPGVERVVSKIAIDDASPGAGDSE